MKKIILLSGLSHRFTESGYPIKPLISLNQTKIIELAVKSIYENEPDYKDYIFVVKDTDVLSYNINCVLQTLFKDCKIRIIKQHKYGPVFSIKKIEQYIPLDEEIVVCYCDLYINWNFSNFISFARQNNCDGVIASHTGWHPHRIYNNYFAYMKISGDDVLEIQEKKHFTNEPLNEPASSGIYFFKSGQLMMSYFNELMRLDERVNGEFYVTMPFNLMIKDKLNVKHFLSDNYFCLGTPKDIEIIIGCLNIVKNINHTDVDILNLLNYFKTYFYFSK